MRYLLTVSYLGKNYCGSQKQPHKNTIQDKLEEALCTLIQQNISTIFSGRTDTGVNALGQTLHIDLDKEIEPKRFIYGLNHLLPEDIIVTGIKKAANGFHAQMSAEYRHYQYLIRNTLTPCVFDTRAFHTRQELDVKRLNQALEHIIGEHDFSAFKSSSDNPAKVCNIYLAKVVKDEEYIKIDIVGDRFLYNMVRTIVGTLLEIEKEDCKPAKMSEILNSKDRTQAGPTADACGLTLIKVGYEPYIQKIK